MLSSFYIHRPPLWGKRRPFFFTVALRGGAGSLGTILGAFITRNGGEIDLINHNARHIEALSKNGAHVTGTLDFTQRVSALTPEEMSGKYDIIFLMTKQQSNPSTVKFLRDFLATDGVIVKLLDYRGAVKKAISFFIIPLAIRKHARASRDPGHARPGTEAA